MTSYSIYIILGFAFLLFLFLLIVLYRRHKRLIAKIQDVVNIYEDNKVGYRYYFPEETPKEISQLSEKDLNHRFDYAKDIITKQKVFNQEQENLSKLKQLNSFAKITIDDAIPDWGMYWYGVFIKTLNLCGKEENTSNKIWNVFPHSFSNVIDIWKKYPSLEYNASYANQNNLSDEYNQLILFIKELEKQTKLIPIVVFIGRDGEPESWEYSQLSGQLYLSSIEYRKNYCLSGIDSKNILVAVEDISTRRSIIYNAQHLKDILPFTPLIYVSLYKAFDCDETRDIVKTLRKMKRMEERKELLRKKETVENLSVRKKTSVEKERIEKILQRFQPEVEDYTQDLIFQRVQYNVPFHYLDLPDTEYVSYQFPRYNNIVFPPRMHKDKRRGYLEGYLEASLKQNETEKLHVLSNVSLVLSDQIKPYEPDIAIIYDSDKNIRIDIEVDEPYSGLYHEPIHYVGCGDEFRDLRITNAGWIVIRFAEVQIWSDVKGCVAEILKLIGKLDESYLVPEEYKDLSVGNSVKKWTNLEATIMAQDNYRETYLHHTFSNDGQSNDSSVEKQTYVESLVAKTLEPIPELFRKENVNLDNSPNEFEQDNHILFFPKEHIYTFDNKIILRSVSEIVSKFFPAFDKIYWGMKKADEESMSLTKQLELWDCNGKEAQEVGTFLHLQIENFLNRRAYSLDYHFEYNGQEVQKNEWVSIRKEWTFVQRFFKETSMTPVRSEWAIYDLKHEIAGTIDLLARTVDQGNNHFCIVDWKRSKKIVAMDKGYHNGINGLDFVPDTPYYKYCLQQNLYKYILENNYGIIIDHMYLVIFHPEYSDYRQIEVPTLKKEVSIILKKI